MSLLERAQKGELQIHVQQHGIQAPVNRLAYSVLIAALFLGSSLLWALSAPPTLFGISVFGVLGVLLALAMGLHLLVADLAFWIAL